MVASLVNDIIMPPIGWLLGGVDFAELKIVLATQRRRPARRSRSAGACSSTRVIVFVVVAFVVYLISKMFIKEAASRADGRGDLLTEIRDELRSATTPTGARPCDGPPASRALDVRRRRSGSCRGRGSSS